MSAMPARPERDLRPEDRARLDAAHRRLRDAVKAYEPFLGGELRPGEPESVHSAREMGAAQAAIESAENELWKLRELLLGWTRPSWTPRASLVADWFSDEDSVYDDEPAAAAE